MTVNIAETYTTSGIGTHHEQQVFVCMASAQATSDGIVFAVVTAPDDSIVLSGGWNYTGSADEQRAFSVYVNAPSHVAGFTDDQGWVVGGFIAEGATSTQLDVFAICAKLI